VIGTREARGDTVADSERSFAGSMVQSMDTRKESGDMIFDQTEELKPTSSFPDEGLDGRILTIDIPTLKTLLNK
jgi:hypothetical protein